MEGFQFVRGKKRVLIPDFNFHLDPDVFGGPITAEKFRKLNVLRKKTPFK